MLVIEGKALGRRKPLFEGFSVPPPGDLGDGGPLKLRDLIAHIVIEEVAAFEGTHAKIKGTMAEYSVHLGSATTHMLPGGALFIVPVHSQHRGRLFLPFADEYPKTAEVISKVLLLARDQDIRDPNLLEQIRSRG